MQIVAQLLISLPGSVSEPPFDGSTADIAAFFAGAKRDAVRGRGLPVGAFDDPVSLLPRGARGEASTRRRRPCPVVPRCFRLGARGGRWNRNRQRLGACGLPQDRRTRPTDHATAVRPGQPDAREPLAHVRCSRRRRWSRGAAIRDAPTVAYLARNSDRGRPCRRACRLGRHRRWYLPFGLYYVLLVATSVTVVRSWPV